MSFGHKLLFEAVMISFVLVSSPGWASDTLCARVKIEIQQEATLERQAFDATMRISNGSPSLRVEDVRVEVRAFDWDMQLVGVSGDPENESARFFVRVDTLSGIDGVDGSGVVEPSSVAEIHWMIIPSPDAAQGVATGTRYYLGARLSYRLGEQEYSMDVTPDFVFVKPMPRDGRFIQARDAAGDPTGGRIDGPHRRWTHPDPRAQQPHGHVPGVTNPDGTPWLPINQ